MTLKQIHKKYGTQKKCIELLEKLRWGNKVVSPFTGKSNVKKRKGSPIWWHCNDSKKDFTVLHGTIFEHTKLKLPDWFTIIGLMLNAKKGISASQLHRDIGCSYKTAWYAAMRIRCAMIDNCIELQNIVEMDEAYVGGKPRKRNNIANLSTITNKRGRGTKKTPIVGIVERNGKIVLKVIETISTRNLLAMLKENVNISNTIVITDEFPAYKRFDELVQHLTIDHKKQYSKGIVNTNTIEGFWSIVKNSIRGQYIALSKKYLPFYLVQAQYIYNRRNAKNDIFEEFLKNALTHHKNMVEYKPLKEPKSIVYTKKGREKC